MATKKENFKSIINYVEGKETDITPAEIIEFCSREIELLDKRASTPRKPSAKQLENEDLKKVIYDILAESKKPVPMKTIMASADFTGETISNQRMTQLVTALRKEGKVKRTLVKRVAYYEIGCEEEEEQNVES